MWSEPSGDTPANNPPGEQERGALVCENSLGVIPTAIYVNDCTTTDNKQCMERAVNPRGFRASHAGRPPQRSRRCYSHRRKHSFQFTYNTEGPDGAPFSPRTCTPPSPIAAIYTGSRYPRPRRTEHLHPL
ncbi:hypothetical protein EYF80_033905 [Liparis tanakae]|uniref:Uncharacterized protein n=1 Tax=Liparis tanakae TaxID=230148 RepID=A0A4Z2GR19_9TELE|nr:hypothetical protein EYF80_033905 [Liparis tanakae]